MRALSALGYFAAVTVWLTWPLGARVSTALSPSPDSLLNFWALGWSFHALATDARSLFDANIFAPRPDTLAYSEHMFGIIAFVWPVFVATGNLVLTYNVAILSSFFLSGVGMYLLARELSGGNVWAGLSAGTIFMAAPYRFAHILQLQLLTYQWFPFVFWCLLRLIITGRRRFLAGTVVFSLLQVLSCNYYAVYLALSVVIFGAILVAWGRELLTLGLVARLALGALLVAAFSLPFLLPYARNGERGFYRRYEDVVHFSAAPSDYLRPSAFNKAPHVEWLPRQQRSEKALFPGFVAVVLAGLGMWGWRAMPRDDRDRAAGRVFYIFFGVSIVIGFALSLGPETTSGSFLPYRFFYDHVPGFSGMRAPARISVLLLLGVAPLAGLGLARLCGVFARRETWVGAGIAALLLVEFQTYSLDRAVPHAPPIPPIYNEMAKLAASGETGTVLELPIHEGEEITRESLYMYYSTMHWMPLVNGFSGWWPNDYWELVGRLRHFPTSRILRFLLERAPVRYVVIHFDRIPEPRRRELESAMIRYQARMPARVRLGDDVVYEIVDPAVP